VAGLLLSYGLKNSMNQTGFRMNTHPSRRTPFKKAGWLPLLCAVLAPALTCAADATPTGPPLDLKFRDFYQSPIGPAGLQMNAQLRAAHTQRVRLTGYMVAQEDPSAGHFFLTPLPVTMSAHADGEADDLPPSTVLVQMPEPDSALPVLATPGLLQLTGRLQVGRFEMLDGRVVWLRLLLEPRAAPKL
jgi:hypothetical protein